MRGKQLQHAIRMLELAADPSKVVYYIDETTCNTWSGKRTTWMSKEAPVAVVMPKKRQSVSVFGALGGDPVTFYYQLHPQQKT